MPVLSYSGTLCDLAWGPPGAKYKYDPEEYEDDHDSASHKTHPQHNANLMRGGGEALVAESNQSTSYNSIQEG